VIWRLVSSALLRLRYWWWMTVYRGYRARYTIAESFRFNGTGIQLIGDGQITLGARSYVGELTTLQAASGCTIAIGSDCSISHNVRVYTSSTVADADLRVGAPPTTSGSVTIGDGAWIGTNCYIGPGISIGSNAVIGANSVVTRPVPSGEIWGGVPARLIRTKRPTNAAMSQPPDASGHR
jgi:maltose O-acetyltransferase